MRTRKPDYFRMVFDPPWHPGRMSEAAKLQLGLDLDQHSNPVVRISR
jgi:metal-sulfur cluster biosynthetic enzyme